MTPPKTRLESANSYDRGVSCISVKHWIPTPLNKLMTCHWANAGRLKKLDLMVVEIASSGLPKAKGKRRVRMTITLAKHQRAPDPDALWKTTLDALVHAGMLTDDNRQGVELDPVEFMRGTEQATTILLMDCY